MEATKKDTRIRQMMVFGMSRAEAAERYEENKDRRNAQARRNQEIIGDEIYYSHNMKSWVTVPEND